MRGSQEGGRRKMDTQERISQEFASLIEESDRLVKSCGWDGRDGWQRHPNRDDYMRIRTRSLNLVKRACGEGSVHFGSLTRVAEEPFSDERSYNLPRCAGILKAARDDFDRGLLTDLKTLVEAEVLGDVLEQAESLLDRKYHIPAASLAGAVLEDALRKLCDAHGILYPPKTNIDGLNSALAKAGAYEKLILKRITGIADIRNNADHGQFDKFTREDVEDMLKWTRRFIADRIG